MEQWYYAANGAQRGPVTFEVLQQAIARGEVSPADLVWKDGMAEWTPAQRVPELASLFSGAGDVGAYGVDTPIQPQGYPQQGYAQPGYAQGAGTVGYANPQIGYYTPPRTVAYAGFWWRFLASFLDGIIMQIISYVVGFAIGLALAGVGSEDAVALVGGLAGLIIAWLYEALQESSPAQATIGKRACGIRVTDIVGGPISFGRATGRHFGKYLSALIFLIGYIMQAFTERRQALHDIMAGTLVVRHPS